MTERVKNATPVPGAELVSRRLHGQCLRCGDPYPGIENDGSAKRYCEACVVQMAEEKQRIKRDE